MKRIFDPLTYRHPRSLMEAFPGADDYASAIEGPHQYDRLPSADRIILKVCAVGFVAVAVMALIGWLPGGAA